jgi:hypothetical protein
MNLGIPTPSRYASELYAVGHIRGPGFSHSLGQERTVATTGSGQRGERLHSYRGVEERWLYSSSGESLCDPGIATFQALTLLEYQRSWFWRS